MALEPRKIKVVFIVSSGRSLAQIITAVKNNVFPMWSNALTTAFAGYQFANTVVITVQQIDNYIKILSPGPPAIYEIYPKFEYRGEVTALTQADARARNAAFLEDVKNKTRDYIRTLPAGTDVLEIHKDNANTGATEVSTN